MNSLKNKLLFLAAVTLLAASVFLVWYLVFYMPGQFAEPDGTLVQAMGKLVKA